MRYKIIRICFGLAYIVEKSLEQHFNEWPAKTIGEADSVGVAQAIANQEGLYVKCVVTQPRNLNEENTEYAIKQQMIKGKDFHEALESVLPMMSEEARKKYVS